MSDEIKWESIPGWPEYECSTDGQIKRMVSACGTSSGKILKWQILKNGYAKVSLCRNAKRKEFLVHRLVAMTFIGPIGEGKDVCHFDGNKLHNSIRNLRIDDRKGNMADQIRLSKTPRGEKCGSNKHAREKILEIREMKNSGIRNVDIAKALGLREQYVCNVLAGRIWAWL